MDFQKKAIWLTWHEHRRTRSLVSRLGGVSVFVFDDHRFFQRNFLGPLWTLRILNREKAGIIFIHFSYLLLASILFYKYLFRRGKLVIISDCHNKALKRTVGGLLKRPFSFLKRFLLSSVDMIIVTNKLLVPKARSYCGVVGVLRDPLTDWKGKDLEIRKARKSATNPYVFFICSFDKDEPVDLILDVAKNIPSRLGIDVVISGNPAQAGITPETGNLPGVRFPGFMPEEEYRNTLFLAEAVVILTNDPDCLVCGAYESIGAKRPTILSETETLMSCFGGEALYTAHSTEAILAVISVALASKRKGGNGQEDFEVAFRREWSQFESVLASELGITQPDPNSGSC